MGRLEHKVALITGAAGGIGSAEAQLFAEEGARVVLADIDGRVRDIAAELDDAAAVILDVADTAAWKTAVTLSLQRFGRLDILVNNAGIFRPGAIADMPAEAFLEIVRVNQLGTFLGMQAVAGVMARGGSIVNTSSVAGLFGTPGGSAYAASKWAIRGLSRSAAMELAGLGIRVNSLHPGGIDTPMLNGQSAGADLAGIFATYPIPRVGRPEEIARAALFLASDESSYMTGTELVVDGGLQAGPLFLSR